MCISGVAHYSVREGWDGAPKNAKESRALMLTDARAKQEKGKINWTTAKAEKRISFCRSERFRS